MEEELCNLFAGINHHEDEETVFFDLETTGINIRSCDICQLSAICGKKVFNAYLFPRCPIQPRASQITGLTKHEDKLLLHGQAVETVPIEEALKSFISFLETINMPILVGHNCKRFDCPILLRILREFNMLPKFFGVVSGFLDTLLLSKEMFSLHKYSQTFLVQHFLSKPYEAHNATQDAQLLQELFRVWKPSKDLVKSQTFYLDR